MNDRALLPATLRLTLASPEATAALARRLGAGLRAGDVILLEGPIGAGKSHFCRSLIQSRLAALGRAEDVPSPTYTLVQVYDLDEVEAWHADLYRLGGPAELVELGLFEAFENAICLIEWPDRLGPDRPDGALEIRLSPGAAPDTRIAELVAGSVRWAALLRRIESEGLDDD